MPAVKDNRRTMPPKRKIDTKRYSGRVAARVRALREERGWLVQDLAKAVNDLLIKPVAVSTVHGWDNGSSKIDPDLYPTLARVFGLKLSEFLPLK